MLKFLLKCFPLKGKGRWRSFLKWVLYQTYRDVAAQHSQDVVSSALTGPSECCLQTATRAEYEELRLFCLLFFIRVPVDAAR